VLSLSLSLSPSPGVTLTLTINYLTPNALPSPNPKLARAHPNQVTRMVCNFKDVDKQKEFEAAVQKLFETGVDVYKGYIDDPRNTDNAWMASRLAH